MARMLMIYLTRLRDAFLPLRLALRSAQCLGGERPNYADSIVWAAFVGFAPAIKLPLLTPEDSSATVARPWRRTTRLK